MSFHGRIYGTLYNNHCNLIKRDYNVYKARTWLPLIFISSREMWIGHFDKRGELAEITGGSYDEGIGKLLPRYEKCLV
jgi:hypothetical protein